MITNFLKSLIEYTITNADVESRRKWTKLQYVKNEHFPLGVFRVHLNDFLPGYMQRNHEIYEELLRLCNEEYSNMIEFDVSSLWITINGNIPSVLDLMDR